MPDGRYPGRELAEPLPVGGSLQADRRLFVSEDGGRVVEEDDPTAGFLLAQAGGWIEPEDVRKFGLTESDGRIILAKQRRRSSNKMRRPARNKSRR